MKAQKKRLMAEINVVPYIDVMLVLLVIFMITTPMLTQGVKINLPQASATPIDTKQTPIIISVDSAGRYYLNTDSNPNKPISPQDLVTAISGEMQLEQQQNVTRPVLVKGDKSVDYGKVMQAMVLLQGAGVANVGLMTDPSDQTG